MVTHYAAVLAAESPPGWISIGTIFISWLKWILTVVGVGGLFVCGIMMTIGRRNRSAFAAQGASGVSWVLVGLSLGSAAAVLAAAAVPGG